ncbi:hypothetical protein KO495_01660 [Colwellia sp. D2M02]|uniref:hypothetical protein n=1 Tax=Colwellia sp. D2M02 TaxID=2841562 RepID=UPI001C0A38D6|nr:hypothetical protein [Colwellia sp. D2M02]MBU2892026.1 hypothetical protein [Colwellia sp. D2M02]
MTNINMSPETDMVIKPNRNRQSLLLLLVVFALPVILAKLALEQKWLEFGVTNQGELINKSLTLTDLGIEQSQFEHQWLIMYLLPAQCHKSCQQTLETVHNSYVALGKEMPRITPVALKQHEFSVEQSQRLAKSQWQIMPMPQQALQHISSTQIVIADPLGNIILSYNPHGDTASQLDSANTSAEAQSDSTQQTRLGKAIITDMKKLLKYSKVG